MLRFAGAAGATGAVVRQRKAQNAARKIRFDMRLSWHRACPAQFGKARSATPRFLAGRGFGRARLLPSLGRTSFSRRTAISARRESRPTKCFALPAQLVENAGEGPIAGTRDQTGSHRIFANIVPTLIVALLPAEAVMKTTCLKPPFRVLVTTPKLAFPKRDAGFDFDRLNNRRTKEMQVIGHENITADHPGVGKFPGIKQGLVDLRIGQPSAAMPGADGEKSNRSLAAKDKNARRGSSSGEHLAMMILRREMSSSFRVPW